MLARRAWRLGHGIRGSPAAVVRSDPRGDERHFGRVFDPDWRSPEQWEALRQALASITHLKVDPSKPELYTGMLNTGHTYGDDLSEDDRLVVLEFLKCL